MRKKDKLKLLQQKLEKPKQTEVNFYAVSIDRRVKLLNEITGFAPTVLSEFAAGYTAALENVMGYGLERVAANAQSGIPK